MTGSRRRRNSSALAGAPAPDSGRAPRRRLATSFFARDVRAVARDLLGRMLLHRTGAGIVGGRIVEVEAYGNENDPASHARPGPTARNASMYGPPGRAYVYRCYGIHDCLNVVTGPAGRASAVLIRALEPCFGAPLMARRRRTTDPLRLTRGPGCVGQALGIELRHDGLDLGRGPLWISAGGRRDPGHPVATSGRIGIRRGRARRWRFFFAGHPCVSGPRGVRPRRRGRELR